MRPRFRDVAAVRLLAFLSVSSAGAGCFARSRSAPALEEARVLVNGEEVPAAEIERTLVYVAGRAYLERKVRDFLVADEIGRRRQAGEPVGDLRIDAEELRREVDSWRRQNEERWTRWGYGAKAALHLHGFDERSLADEVASQLRFDRVFLPEDPTQWPKARAQAFAGQAGQVPEGMNPFYRTLCRQWLTKALKQSSDIRMASNGLPVDVVLTVNDRPVMTAEAYAAVSPFVSPGDRETALGWTAWRTGTRQALEREGVYLSEEDFAREWRAHVGPYEETPFSIEVVAIAFKKFPSYDLYREYFRLRKSFERLIEKEITDEALLQHLARAQDFLGDGKVDAQAILCTAFNYTDWSWKGPDAFDRAKARADDVVAALKLGTSFDDAIDRFSEFFEPPAPPSGQKAVPGPHANRGRFGPQSKVQLKQFLGESDFDEIVRGTSIGEILFHDVPIGEVIGPIRGPLGWYVGRVLARQPGTRPIDLAQENSRNLLREDYLARRFLEWSHRALAGSVVEVR